MIQHGIYHKGYVNFVHAVGKVYSLNQLCLRHGLTGLILVGGGGGTVLVCPTALRYVTQYTCIQLCSRVMVCPNDTWISAQLPDF
jgi:hypothetical protein